MPCWFIWSTSHFHFRRWIPNQNIESKNPYRGRFCIQEEGNTSKWIIYWKHCKCMDHTKRNVKSFSIDRKNEEQSQRGVQLLSLNLIWMKNWGFIIKGINCKMRGLQSWKNGTNICFCSSAVESLQLIIWIGSKLVVFIGPFLPSSDKTNFSVGLMVCVLKFWFTWKGFSILYC